MLITCCRIITYVLLCGYTPFRADDMKEAIRQTTEARVDFHDRYWKNVSDEGMPGNSRGLWECAYLTCAPSITAKNFIRALLHPNPTRRLTAEQALSHTWLTSFPVPTEHDLCGLRENFDPRACWRNAIRAAWAMSHFAKGNGANNNNKKDQLVLSSDDEDDIASRSRLPSSRATLEPDSKRQQQYLSPPSPDDRALRGGLVGLAAKGTPKTTSSASSSSPMSFSDALNKAKAKAAAETEEAREGDAPRAQTTTAASQPHNMEEEDEDEEEEELHIPGSFDFGDQGGGAGRETPGAGTVDPFDAIGMLVNLWRQMQVR